MIEIITENRWWVISNASRHPEQQRLEGALITSDALTKTHALRTLQRCAALSIDALFFVKNLQDGVTKPHS
jgi:hypothetical protein